MRVIAKDMVFLQKTQLHFNDRLAFHDIYSLAAKEPIFYRGFQAHAPQCSIGFSDPQEAKNRRNLLAPSFSRQAVIKLEYAIQKKVRFALKYGSTSSH